MSDRARRVIVDAPGGPEAMRLVEATVGEPGPGEIRIAHRACGLNFIDVYQRSGVYPLPTPLALGMEAAGVVEAVGEGVTHLAPGDRAAYAANPPGAYCDRRVMPAAQVCRLPDAIDFETGAAMMLKGLTVRYLFRSTARLEPGATVLFHAAAGGVGLIACQWARATGVRLIGTAGSDEKCALALAHGAAHAVNCRSADWVGEVRRLTDGAGVAVVMDSVGRDTWEGSLDCLAPFGLMISFGNASGKVPPVDIGVLAAKGSLYLTRPTLFTHIATRERCQAMADDLFAMVAGGAVRIPVEQRFPLERVADAHRALEARATVGATVLTL
jgi:NADPH2:quinone reductase